LLVKQYAPESKNKVIKSLRGRRSNYEIYADIIETAVENTRLTKIVSYNNLNLKITKKYLNDLMEAGLIRFIPKSRTYEATKKGLKFSIKFRRFQEKYDKINSVSKHNSRTHNPEARSHLRLKGILTKNRTRVRARVKY
jgi:predicted transcriptional regulator